MLILNVFAKQSSLTMPKPLCSVVIGTYNRADLVAETIRSVLAQTYRPLEVVAVDDASTDNTVEVLRGLVAECAAADVELRIIESERNGGVAQSYSRGCQEARGMYIGVTGSDDLWHPTNVEKQVALMEAHPDIGLTYSDAARIDVHGERLSPDGRFVENGLGPERGDIFEALIIKGYFVPSISLFFRKTIADQLKSFNPDYVHATDYDYVLRAAAITRIDYVDEILAFWRQHSANLHNARKTETYTERIAMIQDVLAHWKPDHGIPSWRLRLIYSNNYAQAGKSEYLQGNTRAARSYIRKSLAQFPVNPVAILFFLNTFFGIESLWDLKRLKRVYIRLFSR